MRGRIIFTRIATLALGLILLVVVVAGGALAMMAHHFRPPAPQPRNPPATGPLEAQRQDIRYFRQLIELDRSFAPASRTTANRRLDELASLDTTLDRSHLQVQLMRIDALADNGHSRVEIDRSARPLMLPVRVAAFSDGLYVMRATDIHADLLGGRLTAIAGQPIDAVLAKLTQLRGGTLAWRLLHAAQYLVQPDLMYGSDVAPDLEHSDWTVQTRAGTTITRKLDAYAPPAIEPEVSLERWLSSEPLSGMTLPWLALEPDRPLPLSWADFDRPFKSQRVPGGCAQFVQLKSNADQGRYKIRDFLSETESRLRQARPCSLILDLRYDDGGDYVNTYAFARRLPELIPADGKIILLTGPATFSAGISTAAFLKHAGRERVTILGEPVGDRLQFFSEGGRACLPNNPLCVAYQTGKHDYQNACTDLNVCFWLNYLFEFRVRSLEPDEVIPLSFEEWRAGVDPVLERAISLAIATPRGRS